MFQINDFVVYGTNGVCVIKDICTLDMSGVESDRQYYMLEPIGQHNSHIYYPTDGNQIPIRRVMSVNECKALISKIPDVSMLWFSDCREREREYKKVLISGDSEDWVRVIKTLYNKKIENKKNGKNLSRTDEYLFKSAKDMFHGELSVVLDIKKDSVEDYISEVLAPYTFN